MQVAFEPTMTCTLCGQPMLLREGKFGRFMGCMGWPECDGIQQLGPDGKPRGEVTDKATRVLRHECHQHFDPLWQKGRIGRKKGYARLARMLGVAFEACHFGFFDAAMCQRALVAIKRLGHELPQKHRKVRPSAPPEPSKEWRENYKRELAEARKMYPLLRCKITVSKP